MSMRRKSLAWMALALLALSGCGGEDSSRGRRLLNVSYDPTRELYQEMNAAFVAQCESEGLKGVRVEQSHGGSGKQARAVLDGLEADVVTLALGYDIDMLSFQGRLLPGDWATLLPNHSVPSYSTIVLLVRSGNPRQIRDWDDLVRDGVEVITPNPKTSGGARWNYLAALAWATRKYGSRTAALEYLAKLFRHVPVLDTGARGATNTFVRQRKGDVLIAWESEALLAQRELPDEGFEIVYPSLSIKAEPPVAMVTLGVQANGTRELAEKYLLFLYSDAGQAIAARHFYRPFRPEAAQPQDLQRFRDLPMVSIAAEFGGWMTAHAEHFANGGTFDQIMAARNAATP